MTRGEEIKKLKTKIHQVLSRAHDAETERDALRQSLRQTMQKLERKKAVASGTA